MGGGGGGGGGEGQYSFVTLTLTSIGVGGWHVNAKRSDLALEVSAELWCR